MELDLTDEELIVADCDALTSGLSTLERVEWSYIYAHRAINLQGKLIRAYTLDNLPWIGEDIPIPQVAKAAWKASINALATRIVSCQTYVVNHTD